MRMFGKITEWAPIEAPKSTLVSLISHSSADLSEPSGLMALGTLSLVKQTCGPRNTPSAMRTPWYTDTLFCILQFLPICTPKSM